MNDKVAVEFYQLFTDQTWDTVVCWINREIFDSGDESIIKWAYDNIFYEHVVLIGIYGILEFEDEYS